MRILRNWREWWLYAFVAIPIAILLITNGCGQAVPLTTGEHLGPAEIGDDGTRSDGVNFGTIYNVTQVYTASGGIAGWINADMPFDTANYPVQALGSFTLNTQTPFEFNYSYPPNNYKLGEARLVILTARDTSDTEGLFINGVFSGRIPQNAPSTSTKITDRRYVCIAAPCAGAAPQPDVPANTYYMDYSLTHFKRGNPPGLVVYNTFDLDLVNLLSQTSATSVNVVSGGSVRIVIGDDSPAFVTDDLAQTGYGPFLFLKGVTISKTPLNCTTSSTYRFRNVYVHNDGNSIGLAAFSGSVVNPRDSYLNAQAGFRSVEYYFDPAFPKVSSIANITVTMATMSMTVKRQATGTSAIVINGLGVSETGFDRNQATAVVESWSDTATAAWDAIVAGIPATATDTHIDLDLVALLGAGTVRDLVAQGKFNIAIAGSLATSSATGYTAARTYGAGGGIDGPEFALRGTFNTQICDVPNDPASPINDSSPAPSGPTDTTSPVVSSVQVTGITSSSATIQWLTDEGSDTQVGYGIGDTATLTTLDPTMLTFHSVTLTGLQPYKYYYYAVRSKDSQGNATIYSTKVFRTLR